MMEDKQQKQINFMRLSRVVPDCKNTIDEFLAGRELTDLVGIEITKLFADVASVLLLK
jgi:hypothetical protein